MRKPSWFNNPYPYAVIDNFLPTKQFELLTTELEDSHYEVLSQFKSPLENKTIYQKKSCKDKSKALIKLMASDKIKEMIQEQTGNFKIYSLGDFTKFEGYSPFHITRNNGYLGSHIDHSHIKRGKLRHIANTIFYASSEWDENSGGETILFSKNGLKKKVMIDPKPNRLIIFIHTANSFHGVAKYFSNKKIERRTFYHDYYVNDSDIDYLMMNINKNRKDKLTHSFHGTTFVPFIPFGCKKFNIKNFLNIKSFRYIPTYIVYLINLISGKRFISMRDLILFLPKKFFKNSNSNY